MDPLSINRTHLCFLTTQFQSNPRNLNLPTSSRCNPISPLANFRRGRCRSPRGLLRLNPRRRRSGTSRGGGEVGSGGGEGNGEASVDAQVLVDGGTRPGDTRARVGAAEPVHFWSRKNAWEELEEKPWISQKRIIILLNPAPDLINLWQQRGGNL